MAVAPAAALPRRGWAAEPRTLKISHQFPGGSADTGDFRDRLVRKFAADVEKRTDGALKFEIYEPLLQLRDELSPHFAEHRGVDRLAASLALAPLRRAVLAGGLSRLLPAAGQHHPDDRADHPAAAQGRG